MTFDEWFEKTYKDCLLTHEEQEFSQQAWNAALSSVTVDRLMPSKDIETKLFVEAAKTIDGIEESTDHEQLVLGTGFKLALVKMRDHIQAELDKLRGEG